MSRSSLDCPAAYMCAARQAKNRPATKLRRVFLMVYSSFLMLLNETTFPVVCARSRDIAKLTISKMTSKFISSPLQTPYSRRQIRKGFCQLIHGHLTRHV